MHSGGKVLRAGATASNRSCPLGGDCEAVCVCEGRRGASLFITRDQWQFAVTLVTEQPSPQSENGSWVVCSWFPRVTISTEVAL